MKKLIVQLFLSCITLLFVACGAGNKGSDKQTAPIYLPTGNYFLNLTNKSPDCGDVPDQTSINSDGKGNICNNKTGDCMPLNLANNPCLNKTQNLLPDGIASLQWSNCSLNSRIMTANMSINVKNSVIDKTCTANITVNPQ